MQLSQLEYFKKVAELEHMTRAAIDLKIAQPALSKSIKDLENEIGYKLFDRNKKGISLNQNGEILYKYAKEIDQCIANLNTSLKKSISGEKAILNILLKVTPTSIPQLIHNFNIQHPDIKFRITIMRKNTKIDATHYDFIFYSPMPGETAPKNAITLLQEELVVAVSKDHAFSQKQSLALKEVENEEFICLSQEYALTHTVNNYCKLVGFSPKIILQCNDHVTMRNLIEAGLGISLVPKSSWRYHHSSSIALIRISDPACSHSISLFVGNGKPLSNAALLFQTYTLNFFSELKASGFHTPAVR